MPGIGLKCLSCGEIEVERSRIRMRVCKDDMSALCYFVCPVCGCDRIQRPPNARSIELLTRAGVSTTYWSLPEELFEEKSGEVIDHDDLLDFHEEIMDPDHFESAVRQLRRDVR